MRWGILMLLLPGLPAAVVQIDVTEVLTDDVIVNTLGIGIDGSQVPVTAPKLGACLLTEKAAKLLAAGTGNGLPDDGRLPKGAHHPAIQLSYRDGDCGPNARRLTWAGDVFSFPVPPDQYTEVHLVMLGGGGSLEVKVSFTFEDGTMEELDRCTVPDWFDDVAEGDDLYHLCNGMDFVRQDGRSGYMDRNDASLFGLRFVPEPGKILTQVTVSRADDYPAIGVFLGAVCVVPGVARTVVTKPKRTPEPEPDPRPVGDPIIPTEAERQAVDRAFGQLTATKLGVAMAAAGAMMQSGGPYATKRALEAIRVKRQGPKREVKRVLAEALAGRLGEEDPAIRSVLWAEFLETLGKERSTELQEPLVEALATYPDAQRAQDELIRFYPHAKNDEVRIAIVEQIGKLGQPGAMKFLQKCACSRFSLSRLTAVNALYGHDEELARGLSVKMALEDDYNQNRIAAIKKLGEYGDDHLDTFCKAALNDGSWYVRRAAYQQLQRKHDVRVVDTLCAGLRQDPKEDIRMMIPPMMQAVSDAAWNARMVEVLRRRAEREGNRDVLRRIRAAINFLQ